jgi:hypothetical protein
MTEPGQLEVIPATPLLLHPPTTQPLSVSWRLLACAGVTQVEPTNLPNIYVNLARQGSLPSALTVLNTCSQHIDRRLLQAKSFFFQDDAAPKLGQLELCAGTSGAIALF